MRDSRRAARPPSDLELQLPEGSAGRRRLQTTLGAGEPPIVVASMSRAGSTVLHKGVARSWARARFGAEAARFAPLLEEAAWRLDETPLIGGVVYKTHDLPENLPRAARAKVLFTYRRASDVALSLAHCRERLGDAWFMKARRNLRGRGRYENFLREDTLGLEGQVDGWSRAEGVDVLGLRYETLWDHIGDVEEFLGFKVKVRGRRASIRPPPPSELAEILAETYGPADRKIDAMPDLFVRRAAPDAATATG